MAAFPALRAARKHMRVLRMHSEYPHRYWVPALKAGKAVPAGLWQSYEGTPGKVPSRCPHGGSGSGRVVENVGFPHNQVVHGGVVLWSSAGSVYATSTVLAPLERMRGRGRIKTFGSWSSKSWATHTRSATSTSSALPPPSYCGNARPHSFRSTLATLSWPSATRKWWFACG